MSKPSGCGRLGVGLGVAGRGVGLAGGRTVTDTCLNHQPWAGVCTYTDSVLGPAGSVANGRLAFQPDWAKNGLPIDAATSGRVCPNCACASGRPLSRVPRTTSTSSAPAQPWAVRSTNQPDSPTLVPVRLAFGVGESIAPAKVPLSPDAAGPAAQPA